MPKKFLVLGNMGYLGEPLCRSLILKSDDLQTLEGYMNDETNFSFLRNATYDNSFILNLIAQGVNSTKKQNNSNFVNGLMLDKLLNSFIRSEAKYFIHFGSHYELVAKSDIVPSRLSYVDSKIVGSNTCKSFMRRDSRIKLLYLPTIITASYSKGRFFSDFIDCSITGKIFKINYPNSRIQISTFDNFFDNFYRFIESSESILQVPAEINCSVLQFAELINSILVDLNLNRVAIDTDRIKYNFDKPTFRLKVNDSCILRMQEYVTSMRGVRNE
jgi:hypothetical protein